MIATPEELELINQGLPVYNYIPTGPDTAFLLPVGYLPDAPLDFITRVFSIGDVFNHHRRLYLYLALFKKTGRQLLKHAGPAPGTLLRNPALS